MKCVAIAPRENPHSTTREASPEKSRHTASTVRTQFSTVGVTAHLGGLRTFTMIGGLAGLAGELSRLGWTSVGLVLVAGLVATLSVPPFGWWPAAFAGLALLARAMVGRSWRRRCAKARCSAGRRQCSA